jgi:hypothetical protein
MLIVSTWLDFIFVYPASDIFYSIISSFFRPDHYQVQPSYHYEPREQPAYQRQPAVEIIHQRQSSDTLMY